VVELRSSVHGDVMYKKVKFDFFTDYDKNCVGVLVQRSGQPSCNVAVSQDDWCWSVPPQQSCCKTDLFVLVPNVRCMMYLAVHVICAASASCLEHTRALSSQTVVVVY